MKDFRKASVINAERREDAELSKQDPLAEIYKILSRCAGCMEVERIRDQESWMVDAVIDHIREFLIPYVAVTPTQHDKAEWSGFQLAQTLLDRFQALAGVQAKAGRLYGAILQDYTQCMRDLVYEVQKLQKHQKHREVKEAVASQLLESLDAD